MSEALLVSIVVATIQAGTPFALAGLGELVTERSGVLNLGVEGMMLTGAVVGFMVTVATGSYTLGFVGGTLAGMLTALIFAVLTQTLLANQVAAGLALTIFGTGLSAFLGRAYTGISLDGLGGLALPGLDRIPFLGPALFQQDAIVYLSWLLPVALFWFLYRTQWGLVVRAIGESPAVADALGYPVIAIRYVTILFGGAMCGLAGAYLSLVYTPLWQEGMTSGRGWIALALVVFATWRPGWVMVGAYLFGFVTIANFQAQALGWDVPPDFLAMLPYLATIVALVLISADQARLRLNAPLSLTKNFHPTR
ncbi:MAG TPA: ABC transporter permease [Gammaproteobacteria bacterium]|nr:ABC transporter permease [Gammaproteobacteria bacterium]